MLTCGRYLSSAAATPFLSPLRTLTLSLLRHLHLRLLSSASTSTATAVESDTKGGGASGGGDAARLQWKAAIDFKWIHDNMDAVAANIRNQNSAANLDLVLQLYDQYLALQKVSRDA